LIAKDQAQKCYCMQCNTLLKPNYLVKPFVSHAQQQQDEQKSGCSIKKIYNL